MEPHIQAEDSVPPEIVALPWNQPGNGGMFRQIAKYIGNELGEDMLIAGFKMTAEEWHSLLLDAYREMVALGLITSPK